MEPALKAKVESILDPEKEYRKKEYQQYLASSKWAERKQEAAVRAQGRCQLCNSPSHLQVHHRTYERAGEELPQDLTVLCGDCHYWFHKTRFGSKEKIVMPPPEKIYIVKKGVDKEDRHEAFKVSSETDPVLTYRERVQARDDCILRNKWGDLPQQKKVAGNKPRKGKRKKGPRHIQPRKLVPGSSPYLPRKVCK